MRQCGSCQLCCIIPPHSGLDKPGAQRCCHLSRTKGCKVYDRRPRACRLFRCQWLSEFDTADMRRPDRCHYLIDPAPDVMETQDNITGARRAIQCVQVWCDPAHPEAYRDEALLRFLWRRGEEGIVAIIRYGNGDDDFILFPPQFTGDGTFQARNGTMRREYTAAEVATMVGEDKLRMRL